MKGTFLVDEDGGVRGFMPNPNQPDDEGIPEPSTGFGSNVYTDEEWEDMLLEMEGIE
jgi:hypothetical protein